MISRNIQSKSLCAYKFDRIFSCHQSKYVYFLITMHCWAKVSGLIWLYVLLIHQCCIITSRAFKLDRNSLYEYIPDGDSHKDFDKWSHQSREHLSGLQGDILRKGYLNFIETCQMQFKRRTYSKTGPYI